MENDQSSTCNQCGLTVEGHLIQRHSSPYICVLCDPPKESRGKKSIFFKIILMVAVAVAGFFLQKYSYQNIAELRQISRIPQTQIMAAVPGEVNLTGKAQASTSPDAKTLLKSPHTGSKCFYYDYHKEREERDSDGNTRWVTVERSRNFIPFDIKDSTGTILIKPSDAEHFRVKVSHQSRSGRLRYTERRIDPNNRLFIFGYLSSNKENPPHVDFITKGDYHPLISEKTESRERESRATTSVWLCWLGLGGFALASVLLFMLLGHHRILVFFGMLTFIISGSLFFQGINMMVNDLSSSQNRVDRQAEVVRNLIQKEFSTHDLGWNGEWKTLGNLSNYQDLPAKSRAKLRRVRIDLAIATQRSQTQAAGFPYNLIKPFISAPDPPNIYLPERDQAIFKRLNSRFKETKMTSLMAGIGSGIAAIVAIISLYLGFGKLKKKRIMENIPTSPSSGVTYGISEVSGIADFLPSSKEYFTAPLSSKACLAYRYKIQEQRGNGKKARWVTVHNEKKKAPFLIRDRDGAIPIDPKSADIHYCQKTTKQKGRKRYSELRLQLGDPVYALGYAQLDPSTGESLHLAKGTEEKKRHRPPFIISGFQEEHLLRNGGATAALTLNITFSALLFAGLMLFAAQGSLNPASYLVAALIGPALMILITVVMHYYDLIFLRQRAKRNWANIDVALQKRNDLIPQLEILAKESLAYEKELFTLLTKLRTKSEKNVKNANQLAPKLSESCQATKDIIAKIEAYPQIQTNTTLTHLSRQLIVCENDIAFTAAGYNDAVETYNTRIASFPDLILARALGFRPFNHLDHPPEKLSIPQVFM